MKLTAVLTLPGPNFNYEVSEQKLTIHSEVNGHSHFAFSLFHRNLLFSIKKGFATFLTTLVYWDGGLDNKSYRDLGYLIVKQNIRRNP